jgi:hypothetical protein
VQPCNKFRQRSLCLASRQPVSDALYSIWCNPNAPECRQRTLYLARRQPTLCWTLLYLVQPIAMKRQHLFILRDGRRLSAGLYSVCSTELAPTIDSASLSCETADDFPLDSTLSVLTELAPTIDSATLYLARRQTTFRWTLLYLVQPIANVAPLLYLVKPLHKTTAPLYLARRQTTLCWTLLCLV